MSQSVILLLVSAWFVVFLLLGQSVATVLLGSGMVGIALWTGGRVFDGIIGPDIFYTASIYSLSIIPLYLVMAQLLLRGGVIVDLFRVAHRLSGYRRFPLGIATILTGGLLGAARARPARRRWPRWQAPNWNGWATRAATPLVWRRFPGRFRPSSRPV